MIKFEKVSKEEFTKSVGGDLSLYDNYSLPKRNSDGSAGYDFRSLKEYVIKAGEELIIPTGVKASFPKEVVLLIAIRSSMAFKHKINLINQMGVIDSDYYGDVSNEGHIYIGLKNVGTEDYTIMAGDKIAQGVFVPCCFVTEEEPLEKRDGWTYMKERK